MDNLNYSSPDSYEATPDLRRPYKAPPQLIEISLVEEKAVLGICKSSSGVKNGPSSGQCKGVGGSPCMSITVNAS